MNLVEKLLLWGTWRSRNCHHRFEGRPWMAKKRNRLLLQRGRRLLRPLKRKKILEKNSLLYVVLRLIRLCSSGSNTDCFLLRRQVSIERNELLAEQLACSRAEIKLNIQGKKVALVAQVSDLLRKERQALREYRAQVNYDSADSECTEIKHNIEYYKKKTEEAKGALEEPKLGGAVEPPAGAPLSSVTCSFRSDSVDS
jgi:hypothetical protein